MTKLQLGTIGGALVLFLVLYIGCDITPRDIQALEKSRALEAESTNLEVLLRDAKAALAPESLNNVSALEIRLDQATEDSARAALMQELSGEWFSLGQPAIAGAYAMEVAQLTGTEESWSIAGTTFTLCVQRSEEDKVRAYCSSQAVEAFENAISINPANMAHQVNLALLFVESPPSDNPMKGITMLRDLNQKDPENVLVLNSLGRLAIRTGQYQRAVDRLEEALKLEPKNKNSICLLAQAYEGLGDTRRAGELAEQCQSLPEKSEE